MSRRIRSGPKLEETDPEVLEAYMPKGSSRVACHPRFHEIIDRLLSGWSSRQIQEWSQKEGDYTLTWQNLENYCSRYIPRHLLAAEKFLDRAYRVQAKQIHVLNMYSRMAAAQYTRLSRLLEEEQRRVDAGFGDDSEGEQKIGSGKGGSYLDSRISAAMRDLSVLLDKVVNIQYRLGLVRTMPLQIQQHLHVTGGTTFSQPTNPKRAMPANMNYEEIRNVLQAARKLPQLMAGEEDEDVYLDEGEEIEGELLEGTEEPLPEGVEELLSEGGSG